MPLPLRGDGDPVRVEVTVSGYAFCGATAGGTLMFRLPGAQTTIDFSPGTDREFVTMLSCSSNEIRGQVNAVVCLVAQRDDEKADRAHLDVLSVDAQLVAP
ncbi:MAG: hypothetical protein QOK35_1223 [Pseudonocardiales bacterium]|nr:hypothetical protein [Pseudonocardiales bacterium]